MKRIAIGLAGGLLWCVAMRIGSADQTRIPDYEAARRIVWTQLYAGGGDTLYCGDHFSGADHRGVNLEHIFPMAWVTNALDCGTRSQCRDQNERFNHIEGDLHNIFPDLTETNDARASFPFGLIEGERRQFGKCDFEVDQRRRIVEPRDAVRGEIARAMFYMHDEYGLEIRPRLGKLLKQWHFQDPPAAEEKRRNDAIEKLQGTRNPYFDNPELANKLWF